MRIRRGGTKASRGRSGRGRPAIPRQAPRRPTSPGGGGLGGLGRGGGKKAGGGGMIMMLVVVGAIFLMSRGCSGANLGGGLPGGSTSSGESGRVGERTDLIRAAPINRDQLSDADRQRMDNYALDAADDINAYWAATFESVYGQAYEAPAFFPFDPEGSRSISCGQRLPNDVVKNNAIYCPPEDYLTWDERFLFPKLFDNFGEASMAVVLAHEWGHAIQTRGGVEGPTILKDLQADCFAGAWIGSVQAGESQTIDPFSNAEFDGPVAGFLLLRDPPGFDPTAQGAHGTGFDRIGAYEDGINNGPNQCAQYGQVEGLPRIVDLFFTEDDGGGQGNLDLDETLDFTLAGLNVWFADEIEANLGESQIGAEAYQPSQGGQTTCRDFSSDPGPVFWCNGTSLISFNADTVSDIHSDLGDFAVALLFAREYGQALIDFDGARLSDEERDIAAHCLAGTWAKGVYDGQLQVGTDQSTGEGLFLELSPSDLDEAIAVMLRFRAPGQSGTMFERSNAFQAGFFEGERVCGVG